jgi:CHAT domain-containing protein
MIFRFLIIFLITVFSANTMNNAMADKSVDDSLSRAQTFLEQGQYFMAIAEVNTAIDNAPSAIQQSRAYGMKGSLLLLMRHHNEAEQFLLQAFESTEDAQQKANYANSLGVLYHEIGDSTQSEQYFKSALGLAGNRPSLALKIKLNHARSHPEETNLSLLNELLIEIATIDSATERTRYYLNLAETVKSHGSKAFKLVQKALEKAKTDVFDISNKHLQLEILDSLADFYETQGQDQQALELSEQASSLAGQMNVNDLMLQIEWRKGRIYQRQGRDDYALAAFGKAVDHIQAMRLDIPVKYEDGKSSFRETMEPIYLGYAHHLLIKSGKQEEEAKQRTLHLVRHTIEQIKQTELEDFLGGRCLIEGIQRNEIDNIDHQAAIIYPIIFSDRLEILVEIGNEVRQYTVEIKKNHVRREAKKIADSLRFPITLHDKSYRRSSELLYQWIIAPMEQDLIEASIKTLVFVPDGVLRLVPFAALFDGTHFLVEKYAISISPGMSLLGSSSEDNNPRTYRALLAGISKPGPVVEKLPETIINAILQPGSDNIVLASRGTFGQHMSNTGDTNKHLINQSIDQLLKQEGAIQKIQVELGLPGVKTELENLNKILRNTLLLNHQFTVDSINQQLSDEPYDIVHIASHGLFTSDTDSSFLMAYDNLLKLDDFSSLLNKDNNARGSIQLLTLSACETAEGDDRAPLGFAGIALKADALSALGSLWSVSDAATSLLMVNFYSNLTQHTGKAESLRQAQLKLLKSAEMRHPFFWSPFILVGNWL